ncbi:alpha/beta fold hydrolase [Cyanobium sp. CH-040]|uniref:alpha/beta fold hydrolase n=1 Tax=Cyanobium sp. CH-040 TaxID=2823708 RepID=UPI0020CC8420|nr:alpha/beta hydrolase [Cyanobium sp. CH-040]MCP9928603.1 alpha/beta hydrolase [Cyanobium sp. CH-040]
MTDPYAGCVDVNGTRLYVEVAGVGDPLVLIHGFALDARYWDGQFEAFSQHHRVIRYDRRGYGRSANPTAEPYSHVDDLKALLEHLGAGPAHVLGHSDGAYVAVDFALEHPWLTRSLIAVGSGARGVDWPTDLMAPVERVFSAAREQARRFGPRAGNEAFLTIEILRTSLENPAVSARLRTLLLDYPGWHWCNADPEIPPDPPAAQRLGELGAPVCLIVGEREHPGNLLEIGFTCRHIPQARLVVIPGAGHAVNLEAPARFNETVQTFLESAGPGQASAS